MIFPPPAGAGCERGRSACGSGGDTSQDKAITWAGAADGAGGVSGEGGADGAVVAAAAVVVGAVTDVVGALGAQARRGATRRTGARRDMPDPSYGPSDDRIPWGEPERSS